MVIERASAQSVRISALNVDGEMNLYLFQVGHNSQPPSRPRSKRNKQQQPPVLRPLYGQPALAGSSG